MGTLLMIAFRNLVQSRRRTTLVGVAIALVTLFLTLLLSVGQGIQDNMIRAATTISSGHIDVAGFFKPNSSSVSPIVTRRAEMRRLIEENTPGLDYIVERSRGWGKAIGPEGSVQVGLSGLDATNESKLFATLVLAKESEYRKGGADTALGDVREIAKPNTAILFVSQAKSVGVTVGDTVTVKTETFSGQVNTADVLVVAVVRDFGLLSSYAIFVPNQLVLDLYQLNPDTTGAFWVYLKDVSQAEATMGHLREVIAQKGYNLRDHEAMPFYFKVGGVRAEDFVGQQIDVTTWRDEVSFLTWILTGFSAMTWFLTTILVGVIAVGIMNAMWTAVRERTREVGTMRAIGMSRPRILSLFLLEAGLLGLFATTVGAVLGLVLVGVVNLVHVPVPSTAAQAILLSDTLHLAVSPVQVLTSILVLSILTALSALWPALRAATLRPVQALAHVE